MISAISLWTYTLQAQIGGEHVFEFLNLPQNARATALGEYFITSMDGDLGGAYHNPATLNGQTSEQVEISYDFFLSDISRGRVAYGFDHRGLNMHMAAALQFVNYGDFIETDDRGSVLGSFSAHDLGLTLTGSRDLYEHVRLGANLHVLHAAYAEYNSTAIAADLSALYHNDDKNLGITLVFKNIGTQLSTFDESRESLPFDIQLGITRKLEHLPFRFSIVAHHLHQWNIVYVDQNAGQTNLFGVQEEASTGFFEDFLRHLAFNGELYIGSNENLTLRIGYNHLRGRELALSEFRTLSGFSAGFGLRLGKINLGFGLGKYHTQAAAAHLSLSMNLKRLTGTDTSM